MTRTRNADAVQSRTALLVMDVQRSMVQRMAQEGLVARIAQAIAAARSRQLPVIYVVVQFRAGYPEVSPRNESFSALAGTGSLLEGSDAAQIHPDVAPADGDVVVVKRRISAFSGSDLDVVLSAGQIDSLVLAGIATSGVVLSTVRQAADRDYALTVLSDCCADGDEEVHRVLLEKIFPRQAEVLTVAGWRKALDAAAKR